MKNSLDALKLVSKLNSGETKISSVNIQAGKWYHVITTFNHDEMTMMLDGEIQSVKKSANTDYKTYNSVKIKIGQYPNLLSPLKAFKNSKINLDNIVIWDRMLSEEEREKIYLLGFGKFHCNPHYLSNQ